jgi:hypothetical protein
MADRDPVEMSADERDEFLGTGGTGVVSFQTAGRRAPYSLPVSYGYDEERGAFYFRLAFPPESGKERGQLESPVSFVTYDRTDEGWRSVVATGELEEVSEENLDTEVLDGMQRIHIPLYDVFEGDPRQMPFRFFHLDPASLTARRERPSQD